MNNMSFMNGIVGCIFFILAILNYNGILSLNEYYVFGLTVGGICICIATCIEYDILTKEGKNISKRIKAFFIFLGWLSIFAIGVIKVPILDSVIKRFDANTLLFISLGYTLVSVVVGEINFKNRELKLEMEIRKEYESIINDLAIKVDNIKKH